VTTADPHMQELIQVIHDGLPNNKSQLNEYLQQYYKHRDELTTQNSVIFKGQRILVPESLRTDMISRLHRSHSGIKASLQLARDCIYWPGINDHLQNKIYVLVKAVCKIVAKKSTKVTNAISSCS
jgi:hypothetical protein